MSELQIALKQLEETLRTLGPDYMPEVAPGLTEPEIQALSDAAGGALPNELRDWYRWANGSETFIKEISQSFWSGCYMTSASFGLQLHLNNSTKEQVALDIELGEAIGYESDGNSPDMEKGSFWEIAITGSGDVILVDMNADTGRCPVYRIFEAPHYPSFAVPLVYRSLLDMVRTVTRCYQEGAYKLTYHKHGFWFWDCDGLEEARTHRAMNPGLKYWEANLAYCEQEAQRSGPE